MAQQGARANATTRQGFRKISGVRRCSGRGSSVTLGKNMTLLIRIAIFAAAFTTVTVIAVYVPASTKGRRSERTAEWRHMLREAITTARSDTERRLAVYESHIFEHSLQSRSISSLVGLRGGIDEFEAFLLSRIYLISRFGVCGGQGLPELHGDVWKSAITVGRAAREESPILIDRNTGVIRCGDHAPVDDVLTFIREFERGPNKAPEPTPRPVTIRAEPRAAPIPPVAHL